jgi:trigger factor
VKSAVETLAPTKVKLTVEVSQEELQPSLDRAYRQAGREINVPGFRRGKVPPRIIDQRVGRGAILEHAINESLTDWYADAVEAAGITPLARPDVDVTQLPDPADPESMVVFTAEVEIRPEIDLPDLTTLVIEVPAVEVSDQDVDRGLDGLRERFGTLTGVDTPAKEGDFVSIDLVAAIGDKEIDSVSGISYEVGSATMLDGLDPVLTGLAAGESASFEAPMAGGEHAGEPGLVTVTVQSVKERTLPVADDDFAQLASEFDTIEELRADVRRRLTEMGQMEQFLQARDQLRDRLVELADVPVPEGVRETYAAALLERAEPARRADADFVAEVQADTASSIRADLLMDALAAKLEVEVTQGDLVDFLVRRASEAGVDASEFVHEADESGQMGRYVAEVARAKAIAQALEQVSVVDSNGDGVDLARFAGPAADDAGANLPGEAYLDELGLGDDDSFDYLDEYEDDEDDEDEDDDDDEDD